MNLPLKSRLRLLLALIGAITSLLAVNAAQAQSTREQRAFNAAAAALHDGFVERAESEFSEFEKKYPKSDLRAQAVLLRAQARYKLGNHVNAAELLASNLDRAGFLADEYLFWMAEACFQDGNHLAASTNYARLIATHPNSERALESVFGEATARSKLGQGTQVIELLTKEGGIFARAVQRTPANEFVVRGLLLLGGTRLEHGDPAAAESTFAPLAGQRISPTLDWQIQHLRCRILLAQDRAGEAWQLSTNLPALAAASPGSRSQLLAESFAFQAQILEKLKRLDDAISVLQTNLASGTPVEPQREALLRIVELSLALGKIPEARQTLNRFLLAHSNAPVSDVVFLSLGELDLKQHAAGVPMSGTTDTNFIVTSRLQRAAVAFDVLLEKFPASPLFGRALLGKGWCLWLGGDVTNSLPVFKSATERLPFSEEQAVARFKWADAQLVSGDFTGALTNYNSVVENYASLDFVKTNLIEQALYQATRAALNAGSTDAAAGAAAKILDWFPDGFVGDRSLLLVGQGFATQRDVKRARDLFDEIVKRSTATNLVPEVQLAIARTYEQEGDWLSAAGRYDEWLAVNTNHPAHAQAEFYRAWATSQAGRETNALVLFTNFVAQSGATDLVPAAQRWVADYHFRHGDYSSAEKNYKLLFQNWPASSLAYDARMMAGRAALARPDYPAAINHFTNLTSDLKCPPELRMQALFAYGGTLMLLSEPTEANRQANLELARSVFNQIIQAGPTNENAAMAWGETGNCFLQLAATDSQFYEAATNAYTQALDLPGAGPATRSKAQFAIGGILEKVAALKPLDEQEALLKQALNNYLDVVLENNLRDGEKRDLFWVRKSGLEALRLTESFRDWESVVKLSRRLQILLPPLRESLDRKIARANEQLAREKN